MAIKTAFTEENLALLEQAIVDGVKKVKYTDKEVEYRSLDEMMKIRSLMLEKLCKGNSSKTKTGLFGGRRINAEHSKGLC
jgi:hypothetical protein